MHSLKRLLIASAFFSYHDILAQVPVSKEPRHRPVFENNYVRILDVHVPAGDTTLFHKHEIPSVFIRIKNAKTGSQVIMEEQESPVLVGNDTLSFEGFYTKPRIHRVWNSDTTEFHVMDVEVLNKAVKATKSFTLQNSRLLIDARPVWVHQLNMLPKTALPLKSKHALLIVALTNPSDLRINNTLLQKASAFVFVPANKNISFRNRGNQNERLAILEFK